MSESAPKIEPVENLKVTSPADVVKLSRQIDDLDDKYLLPEYQEKKSGLEKLKSVFSFEAIKSISTENYIDLLRQHPSDMLTHVIRQGMRDHAGSMWHTSGLNEKYNGFERLLASGGIKSVLGRDMEGVSFDGMVRKFCKIDLVTDRFSALNSVKLSLEHTVGHSNQYADRSSVHFASSVVMDQMYGGETGNEIFFVVPAVVAGSNFKYSGKIEGGSQDQNNDVWVHADPAKGVELDTGFCFIPKDAKVSPLDGSRYNNDGSQVIDSISSQEYWEGYFAQMGTKPKHVIYYNSSLTPTQALQRWSEENGILTGISIPELKEGEVNGTEANKSELKSGISKRAYELINDQMPVDDDFFGKVAEYEKEEKNGIDAKEVNLDAYLLSVEDRQRYGQYKDMITNTKFYASVDPDYSTKITSMDAVQKTEYEKYLDQVYDMRNSAPPLPLS
jgi:hypothetical protein